MGRGRPAGGLRRRLGHALDWRFRAVNERVEAVGRRLDELLPNLAALADDVRGLREELHRLDYKNDAALRLLLEDDRANRAMLSALRERDSYGAAFADERPLVTVIIPTHERTELLVTRSLPSVLGQSYDRLEVVVVGDAAPPGLADAVDGLHDERVRVVELPHRAPEGDPTRDWLVGSVRPRNVGYALARGAWLVDFDDDDELRPTAIERGLGLAREERVEVSYGRFVAHHPDGSVATLGSFPPQFGRFGWQGALVHGGLRFFERDRAAAAFRLPNDWFRAETMLRAGVRFGMHDEIVFDYHASPRGGQAGL